MASQSVKRATGRAPGSNGARALRVLVVDPSPAAGRLIAACDPGTVPIRTAQVTTLAAARAHLAHKPVDLVVLEPELPDGSGLALRDELNRRFRRIDTLVISGNPSMELAVQALRAGAVDYLTKPLDPVQVSDRLQQIIAQRGERREQSERVRRLRRACRKLDEARLEVTEQVDTLCEDLVGAYRELADQMNHAVCQREFAGAIGDELDLEPLLRKTLTFLVEKAGATNAAVFLPAMSDEEFNVGGYVNYDCDTGAADMLLQHLADVMAPRVAAHRKPVHLSDEASLAAWLGDDAAYLAECDVVAFGCRQEGEPLAAVVLFRDAAEPFDDELLATCEAVSRTLGERLVKLIRVHHRMSADPFYSEGE